MEHCIGQDVGYMHHYLAHVFGVLFQLCFRHHYSVQFVESGPINGWVHALGLLLQEAAGQIRDCSGVKRPRLARRVAARLFPADDDSLSYHLWSGKWEVGELEIEHGGKFGRKQCERIERRQMSAVKMEISRLPQENWVVRPSCCLGFVQRGLYGLIVRSCLMDLKRE